MINEIPLSGGFCIEDGCRSVPCMQEDPVQDRMCHLFFAHKGQFLYLIFGDQSNHIGVRAEAGA